MNFHAGETPCLWDLGAPGCSPLETQNSPQNHIMSVKSTVSEIDGYNLACKHLYGYEFACWRDPMSMGLRGPQR